MKCKVTTPCILGIPFFNDVYGKAWCLPNPDSLVLRSRVTMVAFHINFHCTGAVGGGCVFEQDGCSTYDVAWPEVLVGPWA